MSESFGRGESALFLSNPELAAAARRQRLAQGLLEQSIKPRNVGGHAGGLAQMGQALIAGLMANREDERIRGIAETERAREEAEVRALMGGGMPGATGGLKEPATPPGSLPPPVPIAPESGEVPPMATALMNPPGQPAQGGAAPAMPMPPPVPSATPAMAQPGGLPSMDAIMAGMASSSPRVRAAAQMLFQRARDQEERALRLQDREDERRFRLQLAGASRAPAAPAAPPPPFAGSGMEAQANNIVLRLAPSIRDGTATPEDQALYQRAWQTLSEGQVQYVNDPTDPTGNRLVAVRVPRDMGDLPPPRRQQAPVSPQGMTAPVSQPGGPPGAVAPQEAPLVQGPRASLVSAMEPPDATVMPVLPNAIPGLERTRTAPQQTPWDWRLTPGGTAQPLPGGPAARAAEREDRATAAREEQTQRYGNVVMQEVDRIFNTMDRATLPTTGFGGWLLRNLPGTAANDINKLLDTIRAESSFSRLQQMREASPTGGALGQVAVQELELLKATIGSLEQSQTAQQFRDNLNRVHNIYLDIIHGRGNGPERRRLSFEEQPQGPQRGPVRVRTPDEARRLPSGTSILLPDGSRGIVP